MQPDTVLLKAFISGNRDAATKMESVVYAELRKLAGAVGRRAGNETLSATALTHEAYMRLAGSHDVGVDGRRQFFAFAAKVMRNVLIDHARRRGAAKRGGELKMLPLDLALDVVGAQNYDLLELDQALQRLAGRDLRMSRLVELRFFGGLTMAAAAEELGVSEPTATRDWRLARAWLRRELGACNPPDSDV